MIIEIKTVKTKFYRKNRNKSGKSEYSRKCTWFIIECDICHAKFEREKGNFCEWKRTKTHYCNDCYDPILIGTLGNIKRKETFAQKYKNLIGTRIIDNNGYFQIYVGNDTKYSGVHCGRIREHLKIMQDLLNRPLKKGEIVHHIDGNKQNNKIDNLDLCTIAQHNKLHATSETIVFEMVREGLIKYDRINKNYYR